MTVEFKKIPGDGTDAMRGGLFTMRRCSSWYKIGIGGLFMPTDKHEMQREAKKSLPEEAA
ncbi:MAG: hypothetical protein WC882_03485 [Candidatus Gracilibacteria bacterium]